MKSAVDRTSTWKTCCGCETGKFDTETFSLQSPDGLTIRVTTTPPSTGATSRRRSRLRPGGDLQVPAALDLSEVTSTFQYVMRASAGSHHKAYNPVVKSRASSMREEAHARSNRELRDPGRRHREGTPVLGLALRVAVRGLPGPLRVSHDAHERSGGPGNHQHGARQTRHAGLLRCERHQGRCRAREGAWGPGGRAAPGAGHGLVLNVQRPAWERFWPLADRPVRPSSHGLDHPEASRRRL